MSFWPRDARRFSRDAALARHRKLWAWVANGYRLRGFDDDRCILEAGRAVTRYRDVYDATNHLERIPNEYGDGPGPISTAAVPSEIRARVALRRIRLAANQSGPHPPGE